MESKEERYARELDEISDLVEKYHPIGRVKGIGRLEALEGVEQLCEELQELREEMKRWPRVFFDSMDPNSSIEGYRVLTVQGKTHHNVIGEEKVYLDVTIADSSGEEIYAPDDFGLYRSKEELDRAISRIGRINKDINYGTK